MNNYTVQPIRYRERGKPRLRVVYKDDAVYNTLFSVPFY